MVLGDIRKLGTCFHAQFYKSLTGAIKNKKKKTHNSGSHPHNVNGHSLASGGSHPKKNTQ